MNENRSALCTAAMVFGIISVSTCLLFNLGFLPGVLGLIFSIICLAKKKEPRGRAKGGLITSIIGLVIGFFAGFAGVLIILFSGLFVGGTIGLLGTVVNSFKDGDFDEVVNVIDNIKEENTGYGFDNGNDYTDYLNNNNSDYSNLFNFDDGNNSGYDSDYGYDDGSYASSFYMELNGVYFEDLEEHGYRYSYGDEDYSVYTNKNGAEFEFPAYVVTTASYGYSNFDAYDNYIEELGVKDNPDYYYDEKLYEFDDEWDYAYCETLSDYGEYEIWMFAFSQYSDQMVILIARPSDSHFDDDFNDFYYTMKYMTCNPNR